MVIIISNVPESRSTFSIYKSADQISENIIKVTMKFIVFENNFEWAFDETTSTEINCFIIVSTFLSLANNLPQLIHSYKETDLSSFKGFSTLSLWIWLFGSICWLIFASGLKKTVLIIHSCISIFSATFLLYLIKKNIFF